MTNTDKNLIENFKDFNDFDIQHKCDLLFDWGLITKTAHQKQEIKGLQYRPQGSETLISCEVVGYIPWSEEKSAKSTVVIESERAFTKIHPAYLKEMQTKSIAKPKEVAKKETGLPTDYIVYDIETTGLSRQAEIIEIAAIKVSENQIIDRFESLICLPEHFNSETDIATHIHGITFEMLKDAPSAAEVLEQFLKFIEKMPLVGHNIISFDNVMVKRALDSYLDTTFDNESFDTLILSRRYFNQLSNHKLGDMAKHFDIPYVGAHRGAVDCEINHQVFVSIEEHLNKNALNIYDKVTMPKKKKMASPKTMYAFKAENITTDKISFDESHFLFGKNCALSNIVSKDEIAQLIKDAGGEPQNSVTRKTDLLIHGDGANTGKVKKAKEYNEKYNQEIEVLSESQFKEKINNFA